MYPFVAAVAHANMQTLLLQLQLVVMYEQVHQLGSLSTSSNQATASQSSTLMESSALLLLSLDSAVHRGLCLWPDLCWKTRLFAYLGISTLLPLELVTYLRS